MSVNKLPFPSVLFLINLANNSGRLSLQGIHSNTESNFGLCPIGDLLNGKVSNCLQPFDKYNPERWLISRFFPFIIIVAIITR